MPPRPRIEIMERLAEHTHNFKNNTEARSGTHTQASSAHRGCELPSLATKVDENIYAITKPLTAEGK